MTSLLRDALVIARREFEERVRTKWFVAMTILGPVFMIAMIVIPALIGGIGAKGSKVAIIDQSGILGAGMVTELKEINWRPELVPLDTTEDSLRARIRSKSLNGYFIIAPDALTTGAIVYRGDNASNTAVGQQLAPLVKKVVILARGKRDGIAADELAVLNSPVNFSTEHTTGETKGSSGVGAFLIAYILAIILYMVITLYGVAVMRSVVVEKTSRVMELMVAAVKPSSLMTGKILGVGAAGLVQVAVWLVMGALALAYRAQLLGMFGASGGGTLPPLEAAQVTVVLFFFVFGFFFYSAMYAAVGALVSSEAETQQVQMPVTMILVIGVLCLNLISNDPRGTGSMVMTLIPAWSPILMPMRYVLGGASGGEVLLSMAILVVSTGLVIRGAAKIYRVGVLMYGKRPGFGEILRWLRH